MSLPANSAIVIVSHWTLSVLIVVQLSTTFNHEPIVKVLTYPNTNTQNIVILFSKYWRRVQKVLEEIRNGRGKGERPKGVASPLIHWIFLRVIISRSNSLVFTARSKKGPLVQFVRLSFETHVLFSRIERTLTLIPKTPLNLEVLDSIYYIVNYFKNFLKLIKNMELHRFCRSEIVLTTILIQ